MPRIRIEAADRDPVSTLVPIYIGHINHGNHLDNARLLGLVGEARVRFFRQLGWAELDVDGRAIVVADVAAQYLSEAFHGETLRIELAAGDFNRYGFDLQFRVRDEASGREVARGKQGIVFTDPQARQVTPVPEAFLARVQAL